MNNCLVVTVCNGRLELHILPGILEAYDFLYLEYVEDNWYNVMDDPLPIDDLPEAIRMYTELSGDILEIFPLPKNIRLGQVFLGGCDV